MAKFGSKHSLSVSLSLRISFSFLFHCESFSVFFSFIPIVGTNTSWFLLLGDRSNLCISNVPIYIMSRELSQIFHFLNISKGNQWNVFIFFNLLCDNVDFQSLYIYQLNTEVSKIHFKEKTRNSDTCDPQCHSRGVCIIQRKQEFQTLVIHIDILGECVSFRIIAMLTSIISFQTLQQHWFTS